MKHEDLKKYWEEEERLRGPQPPLPEPTVEEMAEFLEFMRRMDRHPRARFLIPVIEVEQVIAWESATQRRFSIPMLCDPQGECE